MAILADRLFGFYHAQELAADAKIFLAGVVELFCNYPHDIVYKAVSPMGLVSRHKFPPRIAEIKEYLDERMEPFWREEARQRNLLPPEQALPAPVTKVHHYKTYAEFLLMAEAGSVKSRPIGRFEK